jgi:hypothetical protein
MPDNQKEIIAMIMVIVKEVFIVIPLIAQTRQIV